MYCTGGGGGDEPNEKGIFFLSIYQKAFTMTVCIHTDPRSEIPHALRKNTCTHIQKRVGKGVIQIKEILYTDVENVCMYFPHMYSLYLPSLSLSLSASLFSLISFFFPVGRTLLNKHS